MKVRNGIVRSYMEAAAKAAMVLAISAALVFGGVSTAPAEATTANTRAAKVARARAAHKAAAARARARARAKARAAAKARRRAKARRAAKRRAAARARARAKKRALARAKQRAIARAAKAGWRSAKVSWYGPGFYGHGMAGGGKLRRTSMVVAHRSLPFGTRVKIIYRGRTVIAVVKDRGPFVRGRTFDLGPGTARAVRFSGVGRIRYRVLR